MGVIITQYGTTILSSFKMTMLPRIGESMFINKGYYEVKDVVWHVENGSTYVEIKIEYTNKR